MAYVPLGARGKFRQLSEQEVACFFGAAAESLNMKNETSSSCGARKARQTVTGVNSLSQPFVDCVLEEKRAVLRTLSSN